MSRSFVARYAPPRGRTAPGGQDFHEETIVASSALSLLRQAQDKVPEGMLLKSISLPHKLGNVELWRRQGGWIKSVVEQVFPPKS